MDLPGSVQVNGTACPVTVSDLSASGALVSHAVPADWTVAPDIVLLVEEFGPIDARIVHVGDGFWGLRFANPHRHRDQLARWLQQEVSAPMAGARMAGAPAPGAR